MLYTADFETTTDLEQTRVWAWGVCEIGNPDNFQHGTDIDSFIEFMKNSKNSTFYFHNLKFDSEFIWCRLFEMGFTFAKDRKEEATNTFSALIADPFAIYSAKIIFNKKGKNTQYAQLYDSLKIIPMGVDKVAKAFGLPISKLSIDYEKDRPIGYVLTKEEVEYLYHDVKIMALALKQMFDKGMTKITQASNAMANYKETIGEKTFERWFPKPYYDKDVRRGYKGGFTHVMQRFKGLDWLQGLTLDVNSLYPWVMRYCPLPYGEPIPFQGKYKPHKMYPLYIQQLTCQFELKDGFIPTIQMKKDLRFVPTEYLTSSRNDEGILEEVTLILTNVDLELFFEHYEVYNVEYIDGWMFKSSDKLFAEYVDFWTNEKVEASREKNKGKRTIAKLMQNALYGKFALNPVAKSKYPVMEDGKIKYIKGAETMKEPIYIPVGIFITSWARHKTLTSAQKMYDYFAYADTDSLHLIFPIPKIMYEMTEDELGELTTKDLQKLGLPIPDDLEIHPDKLGAWKIEQVFHRSRFLRPKCYVEDMNPPETWDQPKYSTKFIKDWCETFGLDFEKEKEGYSSMYDTDKFNITCAGMPDSCYQWVTWENFHVGKTYEGKLKPKHVQGGIVLVDDVYTIRPS